MPRSVTPGFPGVCACNRYQALSPLSGLGTRLGHATDACDGSLYHEYDKSYDFREGSPRINDFHHH